MTKQEQIDHLAREYSAIDEGVVAIYEIEGLDENTVGLVVANANTEAAGIVPVFFDAEPEHGMLATVVIEITPVELVEVMVRKRTLPNGWRMGSLRRGLAQNKDDLCTAPDRVSMKVGRCHPGGRGSVRAVWEPIDAASYRTITAWAESSCPSLAPPDAAAGPSDQKERRPSISTMTEKALNALVCASLVSLTLFPFFLLAASFQPRPAGTCFLVFWVFCLILFYIRDRKKEGDAYEKST